MTLWLVLTAMISVAAVFVSAPFIRQNERSRLQAAANLAVYRDQLTEIEAERAQGLIDTAQAENASIEIKRRILATGSNAPPEPPLTFRERNAAVIAATVVVVFGSVLLYAVVGSPELSAVSGRPPVAETLAVATPMTAAAPPSPKPGPFAATTQNQTGLPSVDEMVERLQKRLEANPRDAEGWRLLAWSLFSLERYAEAANAYGKAIELRPGFADLYTARAEARIRASRDVVTADAKRDLDDALRLDPRQTRARYFVGLAKEQSGDRQAAIDDWRKLLADADPSEPWLPELQRRLSQSTGDPSAAPARDASTPDLSGAAMRNFLRSEAARQPPADASSRGPTAEDVRRAEAMAPDDRSAMIRRMVDSLETRLSEQPQDPEGWIKLIRSRVVLGETEQSRKSLQRALTYFPQDGQDGSRIVAAARQLGIEPQ